MGRDEKSSKMDVDSVNSVNRCRRTSGINGHQPSTSTKNVSLYQNSKLHFFYFGKCWRSTSMVDVDHCTYFWSTAGCTFHPAHVGTCLFWAGPGLLNVKDETGKKTTVYFLFQIVVEVVLGEQRGEGVRMGTRCLWDSGITFTKTSFYFSYNFPKIWDSQNSNKYCYQNDTSLNSSLGWLWVPKKECQFN